MSVAGAQSPEPESVVDRDAALVALLQLLPQLNYRFVCPTPATQRRVMLRAPERRARTLEEALGYCRPFGEGSVPAEVLDLLLAADLIERTWAGMRTRLRFSRIGAQVVVHSPHPTEAADSLFFGPDSYRFCRFITGTLTRWDQRPRWIVDVGAGTGVGGLTAAPLFPGARLLLTDINPEAVRISALIAKAWRINARSTVEDIHGGISVRPDLILANPPYLNDPQARLYRHGGGPLGLALAQTIVDQAIETLAPGGALLLYTGVPVIDGEDGFYQTVAPQLQQAGFVLDYEMIDPDVFGEMLDSPGYEAVERIAAVGLFARRNGQR